jgi:tetratricopeptide (TPR) repeat protein
MRDPQWRLDAFETGESATSVRVVFSWSGARLSESAERMFRLLGLHAGPDITVPVAASLAGLPRSQAHVALAELCHEHLLAEQSPGRYACHDLLRAYAAEEACIRDSDDERNAAVHRVLDHYLHTADRASTVLYSCYTRLTDDQPRPGVRPEEIADCGEAAKWFDSERQVLLAAIDQAAAEGFAPHAWQLPYAAGLFFRGEPFWRQLAAAQETALTVAAELGDLAGRVLAHYHLGLLRFCLGDDVAACHHLDQAIELAGALGDRQLCAKVGFARVAVLKSQDRTLEALVQAGQLLRLYPPGKTGAESLTPRPRLACPSR